jgi:hypothetical protein
MEREIDREKDKERERYGILFRRTMTEGHIDLN